MNKINAVYYRAGTSNVVFVNKDDMPLENSEKINMTRAILGAGDITQVDGLGGGTPTSSKLAIVGKSNTPDVDVDFHFFQCDPTTGLVSQEVTCGNAASAVASFAIEQGIVEAKSPITKVRVYDINKKSRFDVSARYTLEQGVEYEGSEVISGVSRAYSTVLIEFHTEVEGKQTNVMPKGESGSLCGIEFSYVNYITPLLIMKAKDFGIKHGDSIDELNKNNIFLTDVIKARANICKSIGIGDVTNKVAPKVCLVFDDKIDDEDISVIYMTPYKVHPTIAVSGSLSLAASMIHKSSITYRENIKFNAIKIRHPQGVIEQILNVVETPSGRNISKACSIRTARPIMEGQIFIPLA